jgi:hypothetical protein
MSERANRALSIAYDGVLPIELYIGLPDANASEAQRTINDYCRRLERMNRRAFLRAAPYLRGMIATAKFKRELVDFMRTKYPNKVKSIG